MTHDEIIRIIEAHRDGKTLQYITETDLNWRDSAVDIDRVLYCIGAHNYTYRIKPEPRVIWVNLYPNGTGYGYPTKDDADTKADDGRIACRKFIEVIE